MADLVVERPEGLYCPAGDFHIDPWRPVPRAIVTHAHADHARPGHGHVLASAVSEGVLRARLGANLPFQGLAWGEVLEHHGVRVSLHPAGHVLGAAQIRLEHRGQVWVVSGDYYLSGHDDSNPTTPPFEPVRCDCFVTESTFGLPLYRWRPQQEVFADIDRWWQANARAGRPSVVLAYSFGKAQRILAGVDTSIGPIAVHAAMGPINAAYRAAGVPLPPTRELGADLDPRALVIVPPMARASVRGLAPAGCSEAFASGWMQLRGARRRHGVDRGFVLSDHADWPGLQRAIRASEATRVIVTHGFEAVLVRWLREQGLEAGSFRTAYGEGTEGDAGAATDLDGDADADTA